MCGMIGGLTGQARPSTLGIVDARAQKTKLFAEFGNAVRCSAPSLLVLSALVPPPTASFPLRRRKETLKASRICQLSSDERRRPSSFRFSHRLRLRLHPSLSLRQGVGGHIGVCFRWSLQSTGPDTLLAWGGV